MTDLLEPQPFSTCPTPLEQVNYQRFSTAGEIHAYLQTLAATSPAAHYERWGSSVLGQPVAALRLCATDALPANQRLRVMLVGCHHGASEAAGGEALIQLARQLLHEDLQPLLKQLEIYLLPDANPDGRDADSSKNANKVNLNRDYVLLSQPESYALDQALNRIRPHVVLDAHESAALKRKTLAVEGYMTEFQAQIDYANNPAIPLLTQNFCERVILNPLLERITDKGLQAQRYIREISSVSQALTYGGVTAHIFRNKAGVCGALSFLLETRMDPKYGVYASFRNIHVRLSKQMLCIREFLTLLNEQKQAILNEFDMVSQLMPGDVCALNVDYVEHPHEPVSRLPMRRIDSQELVDIEFINHRHTIQHTLITRPHAYIITQHIERISAVLVRNALDFEIIQTETIINAIALRVPGIPQTDAFSVQMIPTRLQVLPGFLRVPLAQARGNLVPQLLEPQSSSSLFQHASFRTVLVDQVSAFIYRCPA